MALAARHVTLHDAGEGAVYHARTRQIAVLCRRREQQWVRRILARIVRRRGVGKGGHERARLLAAACLREARVQRGESREKELMRVVLSRRAELIGIARTAAGVRAAAAIAAREIEYEEKGRRRDRRCGDGAAIELQQASARMLHKLTRGHTHLAKDAVELAGEASLGIETEGGIMPVGEEEVAQQRIVHERLQDHVQKARGAKVQEATRGCERDVSAHSAAPGVPRTSTGQGFERLLVLRHDCKKAAVSQLQRADSALDAPLFGGTLRRRGPCAVRRARAPSKRRS